MTSIFSAFLCLRSKLTVGQHCTDVHLKVTPTPNLCLRLTYQPWKNVDVVFDVWPLRISAFENYFEKENHKLWYLGSELFMDSAAFN